MMLAIFASCSNESEKRVVVVIHSWGDNGEEGSYFRKTMEEAFRDADIQTEIHHVYLDMKYYKESYVENKLFVPYKDSIAQWNPDVILVNDDNAMDLLYNGNYDSTFSMAPVVIAGVSTFQPKRLTRTIYDDNGKPHTDKSLLENVCGLEDKIDITNNILFIQRITNKKNNIDIELDYSANDSILRSELIKQLNDSTFFFNNISIISARYPLSNAPHSSTDNPDRALLLTTRAYHNARNNYHLQVKNDLYSNTLIDLCRSAQFTAIREQFNDPDRRRFIGGYFTSTETQIKDQVNYAVRILRGEKPKTIKFGKHEKRFYIDYKAAVKDNMYDIETILNLSDVNVVNLRYFTTHRAASYAIHTALVILAIIIIYYSIRRYSKRKGEDAERLRGLIQLQTKIRQQVCESADLVLWQLKNDKLYISSQYSFHYDTTYDSFHIDKLRELTAPESLEALNKFINYKSLKGLQHIRLRLKLHESAKYEWYDVIFDSTKPHNTLYGIMLNISDTIKQEQILIKAEKLASEIDYKEKFILNMTNEIRTPLAILTENSARIADENGNYTEEEIKQINARIDESSTRLLNIIDNIVNIATDR